MSQDFSSILLPLCTRNREPWATPRLFWAGRYLESCFFSSGCDKMCRTIPQPRRSLQFYSRDNESDDTRCVHTRGCGCENKSTSPLSFSLSLSVSVSRARCCGCCGWRVKPPAISESVTINVATLNGQSSDSLIFRPLLPFESSPSSFEMLCCSGIDPK